MAVSNGWSNGDLFDRKLQDSFEKSYDRAKRDMQQGTANTIRRYEREIEYLRQALVDQMNLMPRPIYVIPPTVPLDAVTREAHEDLEARVAKLEQQASDIVRNANTNNDELIRGMNLTSDRVTTLAQDTTKRCELLQNQIYDLKHPRW
jgi:BMFP domain-containing protein YqiC